MPSLTIGTSDFSIEFWAIRRYSNNPGSDEQFYTGILENDPGDFPIQLASFRWTTTALTVRATVINAGGAFVGATRLGVWNHYVLNADRNGNATVYIDNDLKDTFDISGDVAESLTGEVHALTNDHSAPAHDSDITALGNYASFPVMIGPFAIHSRLMTQAEIELSFRNRTVQSFGAATTQIRFEWRNYEGETGWDLDYTRLMTGHQFGLTVPAGCPLGASGDVTTEDSSGNARHWTLPTLATTAAYDARVQDTFTDENGTWPLAFGADIYFR